MEKPIKVFIVEDHKLLVDGLISVLAGEERFEVVGYALSGEDAINSVDMLKPDVVLMDIVLKGMTGFEACRWIKERHPQTHIIFLSTEIKKDFLSLGIQCGISGYLHKDIDKSILFDAIETVQNGKQYFTEALTKLVFEDFYTHEKSKHKAKVKLPDELTKREGEVLELVALGKTNGEIADRLFISVKTVETHKSHILDKLGLRNSGELIKYAIKNKIVDI